jgi:CspA family cold shock protein
VANGVVKFFQAEKGWGAISIPELPEDFDAFVHYSEGEGFRAFEASDRVEFDYQPAQQDSFRFVAARARRL